MGRRRSLYVETLIRADADELWRLTQEPDQHQRWDLRFTRTEYLPRAVDDDRQRFRYGLSCCRACGSRAPVSLPASGSGRTVRGPRCSVSAPVTGSL